MAKKKSRVKVFIVLGIVAAVVAIAAYAIFGRQGEFMLEAEAYMVGTATIDKEVSANGVIDGADREILVAQVGGELLRLPVDKGDAVLPGTLIAVIDQEQALVRQKEAVAALETMRRNIRSELLNLRSAYTQAKSDAQSAERDYTTAKELYSLGSASEEQLTRATDRKTYTAINLDSVRQKLNFREGRALEDSRETAPPSDDFIVENSAEVRQVLAQLDAVATSLRRTEIRATIRGTVIELPVEKGIVVAPGIKIAVVADPGSLEITSNIDEVDIGYIAVGQEVRVESDVFLNKTLTGRVKLVSPVIQRIGDARVCEITISLADPERIAKIGASCSIYINVLHKTDVTAIPLELYLQEEKKKFVFIMKPAVEPGVFVLEKRQIETGVLGIDKIEIVSGLTAGETIARGLLKNFRDGTRVRLSQKASNGNGGSR